jgi:hypothetical protein
MAKRWPTLWWVLFAVIAFTIGLNFGMHGLLYLDKPMATGSSLRTAGAGDPFALNSKHGMSKVDSVGPRIDSVANSVKGMTESTQKKSLAPQHSESTKLAKPTHVIPWHPVSSSSSPMTAFLQQGKKIPIAILTSNRPDMLENSIKSLLNARGTNPANMVIFQDGEATRNQEIAKRHGIRLVEHTNSLLGNKNKRSYMDGAARIAMHYKFSLSKAFDIFLDAPCLIIVEDDLLFSPDFYEYFHKIAPALENDPSLFLISAWNDNGFKGKVSDPYALRRTEFMPGLGWLLPRTLYKNELEVKWPNAHWDHWLRSVEQHKGREIVYPEVPRTFHNGIKGTFMSLETHNRYFKDIGYNTDPKISWDERETELSGPAWKAVQKDEYESRVKEQLATCHHAESLSDALAHAKGKGGTKHNPTTQHLSHWLHAYTTLNRPLSLCPFPLPPTPHHHRVPQKI